MSGDFADNNSLPQGYVQREGCDHIFFIGFMGAGKSTIVRRIGMMFNRDYVDTDYLVQRQSSLHISDIFEQEGEEGFRARELKVLQSLASKKSLLVSCGDGIIELEESRNLMKSMGFVVYLDIDVHDTFANVTNFYKRPLLQSEDGARQLLERRRPLYERTADLIIDARGGDFKQVTFQVGEQLWGRGLL